ncbi:nucleotidyl transferase AbiEii/AbiGii toxin family protein [Candidatus Woesearchaeota archaeon]|nr:nucleotidyl transferase AbiEii/AbiGii toxin family protein [Candidatus Woesearchaeota archaeon]
MLRSFVERENKIFEILQSFVSEKLNFIVIGGYAVSSYKHRFSVDADLILKKEDLEKFEEVLKKNKFFKTVTKDLDHVYAPQFIRYETKDKLPVSIDLLINGVGSRNTKASFSFEELKLHSESREITGTEKKVKVLVPSKEFIIVLKLHSGRLTDFRDIVALCKDVDINLIKKTLWRGEINLVKENITKLLTLIEKREFIDSFKGVFVEKKYDVDINCIKKLATL